MPRALLSVSDKTGIVGLAQSLRRAGFDLISTGGTRRALAEAGIEAIQVADVTGFPEILGGRVKTLHPAIHAGLLARDTPDHRRQLEDAGFSHIDLLVVNLYPFRETASRPGTSLEEVVEQIDIGGPAMLRAAAKNFERVWVVVDPADYERVLAVLPDDEVDLRRELAAKAFAHTSEYDRAITGYLVGDGSGGRGRDGFEGHERGHEPGHELEEALEQELPPRLSLSLERAQVLRYGENPHMRGALYRERGVRGVWDGVTQHKGSELGYLNVFDADAAWRLVFELEAPACVIVKHANPCGVAVAESLEEAYRLAFSADPKSAFGGVVAFNTEVGPEVARQVMANAKADVLIAPTYRPEALELLGAKRKAMRVLSAPPPGERGLELRRVSGGFLAQAPDVVDVERSRWRVVTRQQPDEAQWRDLSLAWRVCARTSSNAIVLVKGGVAVGIGAGQQSRVDAAHLAAQKAAGRAVGGACASDAFYPFRDGLDAAAEAGVGAVIQPGGSVRDDEVIAAAEEHGIAMVFTGRRHFRH